MTRRQVDIVNEKSSGQAHAVFESIHAIMHLFRAEQYRVLRDGPHELTHMEGRLLGFLARNDNATLRDLVGFMERDKGQLAKLVKSLKAQGLIAGKGSEEDRRSVTLQLTPEGRAIHQTLRKQVALLSDLAVKGLSVTERKQLESMLLRMRANLTHAPEAE